MIFIYCIYLLHSPYIYLQPSFQPLSAKFGSNNLSHNTQLLEAMSIMPVSDTVERNTASLYHKIFKAESPKITVFILLSLYQATC